MPNHVSTAWDSLYRAWQEIIAETIDNNVRKLIIDESPVNPKYYEKMSELLDALIKQRRDEAISYQKYLEEIAKLTKLAKSPGSGSSYPSTLNTLAKRALYDNLEKDEALALAVDQAVHDNLQDDWRGNLLKVKKVRLSIKAVLQDDALTDLILELVKNQYEY